MKLVVGAVAGLLLVGGVGHANAAKATDAAASCTRHQVIKLRRQVAFWKTERRNADRKITVLRRSNKALVAKVEILSGQIQTLTEERDKARSDLSTTQSALSTTQQQLATAQQGAVQAISTMPAASIWPYFSTIASRFTGPKYTVSYFSSGSDYQSWSFTYCGFC